MEEKEDNTVYKKRSASRISRKSGTTSGRSVSEKRWENGELSASLHNYPHEPLSFCYLPVKLNTPGVPDGWFIP
jgi:hypothetical protein